MRVDRYRIVYIVKFILLVVELSRWELFVYHTLVFSGVFGSFFSSFLFFLLFGVVACRGGQEKGRGKID